MEGELSQMEDDYLFLYSDGDFPNNFFTYREKCEAVSKFIKSATSVSVLDWSLSNETSSKVT